MGLMIAVDYDDSGRDLSLKDGQSCSRMGASHTDDQRFQPGGCKSNGPMMSGALEVRGEQSLVMPRVRLFVGEGRRGGRGGAGK